MKPVLWLVDIQLNGKLIKEPSLLCEIFPRFANVLSVFIYIREYKSQCFVG
jgi:hypothetical protein